MRRRNVVFGGLALLLAGSAVACFVFGPTVAAPHGKPVFEMEEVSVFSLSESGDVDALLRGQGVKCETEPSPAVKAYPKLRSERPLYGTVALDRNLAFRDTHPGIEFHFVVDESGAPQSDGEGHSGAAKYDRLYFDVNRDLDLTNDPVLKPMRYIRFEAVPRWRAEHNVVFNPLTVKFDHGQDLGTRPFSIVPRLVINKREATAYLVFTAMTARQGRIRIGSREYDAVLGQPHMISGRFDRPYTALYLTPVDPEEQRESWWGADQLCAIRKIDDQHYTTSTTPLGDKIVVAPYRGDLGVLRIAVGGKSAHKLTVAGSIRSTSAVVGVGEFPESCWRRAAGASEQRLPVGDYTLEYVLIVYGRLRIEVSNNYHAHGHRLARLGRPTVHGIRIRKGKPFVWDFSNEPEVMFTSPASKETHHPGDEIVVKAVLTDPVLDVMIRGLRRTDVKEGNAFEDFTRSRLDPIVTITNSLGEQVAKGKMPFG
ncbi:MAG: hypothetical protein ACYTG0_24235 [Planctomycetota bacterium]|jgi:hypothetical protein